MDIPLVFSNFLTFISGMLPVMGLLIAQCNIKRLRWIMLIEISLLAVAGMMMLGGFRWEGNARIQNPALYTISLGLYPLMMAVMLPFLCLKFGFSRGVALTLLLGYLLTELHEIVGFGKLWLGQFDQILAVREYWDPVFTPLSHAYVVIVAYLAVKVSHYQWGRAEIGVILFIYGVAGEIIIYPHLSYGVYDVWDVARRVIWLPLILAIFILGGKNIGKD